MRRHSIIKFARKRRGFYQMENVCKQGGGAKPKQKFAYNFFLIEPLVRKLLTIITRL